MPASGRHYPPVALGLTVWGLGAALYLIAFYQRVAPAVMTGELMTDFGIGAAALGNLSAFYFYSYVAMQIPTGVLADAWGPRRLLAAGALVAGVGTLLFAQATSLTLANAGRLLIGGSVAVAFVCMLKLAAHWFPPRRFAMVSGMALFTGIIGAVFAGVPLRLAVDAFGWRPVMLASALVTFVVAAAIWLLVRNDPSERGFRSFYHVPAAKGSPARVGVLQGLGTVLRYRNTWLLAVVPGGVVGCVLTFSGLWGVPFLTTHHGMRPTDAAATASAVLVGFALGGPFFGAMSDRIGRRKPLYAAGCTTLTIAWAVALLHGDLPLPVMLLCLVTAGFASGCMIIGFAFAKESVPPALAGTVSGVCNMGVMLGPMVLQPAVGWVLDAGWDGRLADGTRLYPAEAYRTGFSLMVGWAVLSSILILLTRETNCRQAPSDPDTSPATKC